MRPASIHAWALYDFGNTIFYLLVVTLFLPQQAKLAAGGDHLPYALAFYPAQIAAAFLAPWVGRRADRGGSARADTLRFTILCCAATAALPWASGLLPLLCTFALAVGAYQLALVAYNAMLVEVAAEDELGRASGLGVGLGYLGNLFAFGALYLVFGEVEPAEWTRTYWLAAALFLAFSLPLLAVKRRPAPPRPVEGAWPVLVRAWRDRPVRNFLIGNFLCADVLGAVYAFLALYATDAAGLALADAVPLVLAINLAAAPVSLLLGRLSDAWNEKAVMLLGALGLLCGIALAQGVVSARGGTPSPPFLLGLSLGQLVACASIVLFGAVGVGGILGASRKWLVRLVPPADVGAYFGVFGLTNKLSLLSLALFAWLRDATGGYGAGIVQLAVFLVLGALLLARVPLRRHGVLVETVP